MPLDLRSVGGIIHGGGTFLKTARCPEFKTRKGLEQGCDTLRTYAIEGLIVIGGGGSFRGAVDLSELTDVPIIGVLATIDNDVMGTNETIGFDTAVNTALQAIDRIHDTATSNDRIFVVEIMGSDYSRSLCCRQGSSDVDLAPQSSHRRPRPRRRGPDDRSVIDTDHLS